MSDSLQHLLVLTLVAAATIYLVRCAIRTMSQKRQSGCGTCSEGGCGSKQSTGAPIVKPFVPLESLQQPTDDS